MKIREVSVNPDMYVTYLLETTDRDGITTYGITATLYAGGKLTDKCTVTDITPDLRSLTDFCDLLAKNTVTPATLEDVINDSIGIII